jgi:hypothetical protein
VLTFRGEPKSLGPITAVMFEDTCGNHINLVQPKAYLLQERREPR